MKNHKSVKGVWLITFKKSSGKSHFGYDAAVEEALWFAPRKADSGWSKRNKERISRLIAANLIHPAGLETVNVAKADGSWTKLDAVEMLMIPEDLRLEFQLHSNSARNFEGFPRSVRRSILEWIRQKSLKLVPRELQRRPRWRREMSGRINGRIQPAIDESAQTSNRLSERPELPDKARNHRLLHNTGSGRTELRRKAAPPLV